MTKLTFAVVDALTNTELRKALDEIGCELGTGQLLKLKHNDLVNNYWQILKDTGFADTDQPTATPTETPETKILVANPKGGKKAPKECACGCGGWTRGGTWLPGHDAKHASLVKGTGSNAAPKACKCGCGEFTKGGTFRPGHDARYYSKLHASAVIGLNVAEKRSEAFLPPTLNPDTMALVLPKEVVAA